MQLKLVHFFDDPAFIRILLIFHAYGSKKNYNELLDGMNSELYIEK